MNTKYTIIALLLLCWLIPETRALELPAPPVDIPRAVQFNVAIDKAPDKAGNFTLSCFILAEVSKTRVRVHLEPSNGMKIVEAPKNLKGWARPGRPIIFSIKGKIAANAPRPTAMAIHLRYLIPFDGLRKLISTPIDDIETDALLEANSLGFLDEMQDSNNKVNILHRCVMFQ